MRINIRGVIVDSSYDVDYLASYIERGIVTPESHFRRQLDIAAKANEDIDVLVSSYGGNVIAGNDMLVAFKEFAGHKSVTVGAFAASMAANFVLNCGCEVKCYKNSQFLFHGASCITYGGSQAMQDSSDWLEKINNNIIDELIARGMDEECIREGFAEGREMILNADEALQFGIVSKIIDADAAPNEKITASQTNQLAALGLPDVAVAAVTAEIDPEADLQARIEQATAELNQLKQELQISQGESRKVQSAADKRIQTYQDDLARAQLTITEQTHLISNLQSSNEALNVELAQARDSLSKLVGGVVSSPDEASMSWQSLVQRYGAVEALKKFPEKAKAFRLSH